MVLQGQRCALREWRPDDAASLTRHANNPNIAKHLRDRFPHPYTLADAQAFLKMAVAADPPNNFAIDVGTQAVGGLGFVPGIDVERYSAEVGYWLSEEHWNRGIVTEALGLFTNYAFVDLQLLRLFALPFADNTASIRVLEKAGFACEGVMRSSSVKYGVARDQALYARVNQLWRPKV